MEKWADYLISEVSYDRNHLIKIAIRHQDSQQGITKGTPIDRLSIASDIKNGFTYITIYSYKNSWKKGHKIETFSIEGEPYLRIDGNKVKLDFLDDLPESSIIVEEPEPEPKRLPKSQPERITEEPTPEPTPQSPRGSLPKDSAEELPQELDLAPKPVTEAKSTPIPKPEPEEDATPEQFEQLESLKNQIDALEAKLSSTTIPESTPEPEEEPTQEQFEQVNVLQDQIDELEKALSQKTKSEENSIDKLEKEIEKLEAADIEHEIIQTLQKQNKKLDSIEKKLNKEIPAESPTSENQPQAYCVKCKTKRIISNLEETTIKNGRAAVKGTCSVCRCKVFRIGKLKK